ncbi:uncharacterized protein UHOD_05488 [Ustilago sp. UG-2017b]|nr:uncharacterized protein UHOD_05488 [Ustilago sp. UG-2017b]
MHFINRIGLLAALLALAQYAQAATVTVTQISCGYLYFTLGLTPAESTNAQYLGVYQGTTMISEIQFNAAYASTNSYQWYAPFFQGVTVESGPQQISFRLLDTDEEPITAYPAITQTLNFQCGTTVTTSSAAASSPTRGSGRSGNNDSGNSNSGSSSGSSSSNTGAIAGGVAGGVIALAAIGLLAFCLMRKKRQQRNQQSRIRNDEADEAAFRAPNNDSTTSLATAPETVNTPMMRDISTKNVFADPTTSTTSGALSGTSTQFTAANNNPGSGMGAGAAAAGGIGAAAIAARKQSREQTRARSPSSASGSSPSSEFSKDNSIPSSQLAPPVSALPASVAPSSSQPASVAPSSSQPALMTAQNTQPASYPSASSSSSPSISAQASSSSAAPAAAKASSSSDNNNNNNKTKTKTSKWGFNRLSKDMGNSNNNSNSNKLPYPQAVPEPIAAPAPAAAPASSSSTTPSPTSASPEVPSSPSRSFKVIQKPSPAPIPQSMAGPSSASIAPSENSLNRAPQTSVFAPPRSGPATPAGSIRGTNYSRAPSVASMLAGFTDAPPLPSGAASVASAPVGEFGSQNIAGIGAGRSFAASSGNSTKWHQQSYNIMPNFSHRALARSTQLDEDLIFGHLGMGLNPPQPPTMAGNGSETGSARSAKSKTDPFGDR